MKIHTSAIALTLLAASTMSASVTAKESQVKQILNTMVSQALAVASNEIETSVDKSVITAGHMLSLDAEAQQGKVTITDIVKADDIEEKD
jgi:hypothetical protein